MAEVFNIPEDVEFIIKKLRENGFDAYAVGGCVRDSILGRIPGDWDITTDAKPEDVKSIFEKTIDTGIQHGTVTVMINKTGYEVTTYRIDGEYEDMRHPKEVVFTSNLTEDLKRRDFTINAMAFNAFNGIVDEFDGMGDLQRRLIKCVGDPYSRFGEDALRIMRAVRFAAQLSFNIEENTKQAIKDMASSLAKISRERIHTELNKTLLSDNPWRLRDIYDLGIMKTIIPEVNQMFEKEGGIDITCSLLACKNLDNIYLRTAAMFTGMNYKAVENCIKDLKLDNNTLKYVSTIIRFENTEIPDDESGIRHFIHQAGEQYVPYILEFKIAKAAVMKKYGREYQSEEHLNNVKIKYTKIMERGDCVSLKTLKITGNDLIKEGVSPGRELGNTLNRLLMAVLDKPELNEYDQLRKMI